jgi:hypothetical protein
MVSNGFTNLNNLSYITAVVRIYALYIVSEKCRIKEENVSFTQIQTHGIQLSKHTNISQEPSIDTLKTKNKAPPPVTRTQYHRSYSWIANPLFSSWLGMPLFLPTNFPITQTPHNSKSQKKEVHGPSTRNDDKKLLQTTQHTRILKFGSVFFSRDRAREIVSLKP